ncbi:MAG: FKBP-type peptidyl-prolyl cis-trans isomerase [Propioniciclava sp.]|uniref:FKBP-type peptidyl-prolyl cis-trans isomerase n=1 Tax=Propioniciclava sp. TaxID=2038686 RepID=UPI0039E62EF1
MKLPTRLVASLCLCTGLLLAGCSGAPSGTPSAPDPTGTAAPTGGVCDVTVTGAPASATPAPEDEAASRQALAAVRLNGDTASAPTLAFEAPLALTSEIIHVADEGSGDAIGSGQLVTFNFLVCDIVTGEKVASTWGVSADANAPKTFPITERSFGPKLTEALANAKVGARLLWGQPSVAAEQSSSGMAVNGQVFVLSIEGARPIPDAASGAAVTPADAALPTITITDGKPAVSVPSSFADPTELVVQPLIDGDGEVVKSGKSVVVKYTGWLTDGTQFDSSWDRQAPNDKFVFGVGAGGVIQGWDQGLIGQKEGSRVLLVVPASMGYGDQASGAIPANSTLIFVVDILAVF